VGGCGPLRAVGEKKECDVLGDQRRNAEKKKLFSKAVDRLKEKDVNILTKGARSPRWEVRDHFQKEGLMW